MTPAPSGRARSAEEDWAEVRRQFPAVGRCTYLNTAGGGPLCREAAEAVRRYLDEMEEHGDVKWDDWVARAETVRRRDAAFLNARPEEIAFLSNSSSGMNLVAEMMDRGEVLSIADDFPSVTLPWLLGEYPVRFVRSGPGGAVTTETSKRPSESRRVTWC